MKNKKFVYDFNLDLGAIPAKDAGQVNFECFDSLEEMQCAVIQEFISAVFGLSENLKNDLENKSQAKPKKKAKK